MPERLLKPENAHILAFFLNIIYVLLMMVGFVVLYYGLKGMAREVNSNTKQIDSISRYIQARDFPDPDTVP